MSKSKVLSLLLMLSLFTLHHKKIAPRGDFLFPYIFLPPWVGEAAGEVVGIVAGEASG